MADDLETIKAAVEAQEERLREATETLARLAKPAAGPSVTTAGAAARMRAGYDELGSPSEQRAKRRNLEGEFSPHGDDARDEGGEDGDS